MEKTDAKCPEAGSTGGLGALRAAWQVAWPIMAGYVVLGLPCGVLCAAAGMDVWMVGTMALLFYSGAGQYMMANMWLAANPISAIVASVSLVNARQLLYGAALSRFCGGVSRRLAFFYAATVTDETFGVNLARFMNGGWTVGRALLVNLLSLSAWSSSAVAGAIVGSAVPMPTALASFAMTSLFICLLCMQKPSAPNLVAVFGAVGGVVLCKLAGLSGAAILAGALAGVGLALAFSLSRGDADGADLRVGE